MALCYRVSIIVILSLISSLSLTAQCVPEGAGSMDYNGAGAVPDGFYPAGSQVELCYTLSDFQTTDQEWVHSVFLTAVGPGFDFSSIMPASAPANSCTGQGTWGWYTSWSRCPAVVAQNCDEATSFTNGFSFDSTNGLTDSGCTGTANDGDPGNNYGDGDGSCGLTFCWFVTAVTPPPGLSLVESYQLSVDVLADGESGSWSGNQGGACRSPCNEDALLCFPELGEVNAEALNEPCPGELFDLRAFFVDGTPIGGLDVDWLDAAGNVVATGEFVSLPEGSYTLSVSRPMCQPQEFDFEFDVAIPVLSYSGPEDGDFFCFGESIDMSISVTNVSNVSVDWILDGSTVATNTTTYSIAEATPNDAGEYTVLVNYGDGCDTTFVFSIDVGDEVVVDILPNDATICPAGFISPDDPMEITFFLDNPPGNDHSFLWDGFGTEPTFTIMPDVPGITEVSLTITDPNGCTFDFSQEYEVYDAPNITIDIDDDQLCFGDVANLTSSITGGTPPYTVNFVIDGAQVGGPTLQLDPSNYPQITIPGSNPPRYEIYADIVDANGCINFSNFVIFTINTEPARPQVQCEPICVSEIGFTWQSPNADGYGVFYRVNGGPEQVLSEFLVADGHVFTGLQPGDEVEVRVVPRAGDAGDFCSGEERIISCETPLTSTPGFVAQLPEFVCLDATGGAFDLTLYAGEEGTFTLTSAGLGLTDFMTDADSVTSVPVAALAGPANTESYTIAVAYEGVGGRCPSDTTLTVTATRAPDATVAVDNDLVCGFAATYTVTRTTASEAADDYDLQFADPLVGTIVDNGDDTYTVTVDSFGTHELISTTINGSNAACTDTFRTTVTLTSPSPAPVLTCSARGLDFVTFVWTDTGHDAYDVVRLDALGYGTVTVMGNSVTISGLNVDDEVTVQVVGQSAGCPDVASAPESCVAESCPEITVAIDPLADYCANDVAVIDLTATVTNGTPAGVLRWLVNGDTLSGAALNLDTLDAGVYAIQAYYLEGCEFFDVADLTVNPVSASDFTVSSALVCVGEAVTLTATATSGDPAVSYAWTADGTTVSSGTGTATQDVSWTAGGTYEISLTVTNEFGCTSATETRSVVVEEPLVAPTVVCDSVDTESIRFAWDLPAGVDSFGVSINGGPVTFQDTTGYFVDGLLVDSTVTIAVTALGVSACPLPAAATQSCTTVPCPSLNVTVPDDANFCEGDDTPRYLLQSTVTGNSNPGTLTFAGPGVILVGSDYFFDVDTAGVGVHTLEVSFVDGQCQRTVPFTYTVIGEPDSDFTADGVPGTPDDQPASEIIVCEGDIVELAYTGTLTPADNATANYTITPAGPTLVEETGFASARYRFDDAGSYEICLTTDVMGCASAATCVTVTCTAPPPATDISCTDATLTSVTFGWTDVNATNGYLVTLPDNTVITTTDLSYTLTGLNPGEGASISVQPLAVNLCGDGPITVSPTCNALECPALTADFSAVTQEVCIIDGDETIDLSGTVVTGGSGNGANYQFAGTGVTGSTFEAFNVTFDETGTVYRVDLTYTEDGVCSLDTFVDITVFRRPRVFLIGVETYCEGDTAIIQTGTTNFVPGDMIDIDFGAGTEVPDGDPNDMFYSVVFPPGQHTVSATVTSNISGCVSEVEEKIITMVPPLPAPAVSCGTATLETVEITWAAVPNATGYVYTDTEGNDVTLTATETSFVVTGLSPGQEVSGTVRATGDAPCGDGPEAPFTCSSMPCAEGTVMVTTAASAQCLDGNETTVTLTAELTSGQPFNGTVVWSGTGVTDNGDGTGSFDPTGLGVGSYTATVNYDGPSVCDSQDEVTFTLNPEPTVSFTATPAEVCTEETFTVTYSGAASSDATYDWDFAGADVTDLGGQSYELSWATAGDRTVTLTVSEPTGCSADNDFAVSVIAPLATPIVNCGAATLESVTFVWNSVAGATGYSVVTDNGINTTLPAGSTEYTVSGLTPDVTVTATVIALGDAPCGDSAADVQACTTLSCTEGEVRATVPPTAICLDGTESSVALTAELTSGMPFTGTVTWSGTGVVLNPDGTYAFDPTGLGAGIYDLTVSYDGPSTCDSDDTFSVTLNDVPTVTFNTTPDRLCVGETFNVVFTGNATGAATYNWDFMGADVNDLGNQSYNISWAAAGTYTVTLQVTDGNGCTQQNDFTIIVDAALAAPVVTCVEPADLDAVTFAWDPVDGATAGYQISVNGGPFGAAQSETTFRVDGLDFGQTVTLRVIALRTGTTCNESPASAEVSCSARECDEVTLTTSAAQQSFCSEDTDRVALITSLSGDNGNGTVTWTGNGVVQTDGDWFFDPVAAGPGTHVLSVSYVQEVLCNYTGPSLTMEVNETPAAVILLPAAVGCAASAIAVGLDGSVDAATDYTWNFGGAASTDLGGENYELVYAAAGTYTVTLTAERNGCTATATRDIMVEETPNISLNSDDGFTICLGSTDPVDFGSILNDPSASGLWSLVSGGGVPNGSLNETTGVLDPTGLGSGAYTFAYTIAGNACPDVVLTTGLTVLTAPGADAGADQVLTCNMGMVSLNGSNSEGGDGYTYRWTADDPTIVITDADRQIIDVSQPGVYTLRVTNPIGCTATDEVVVTAENEAPVMQIEVSQITCFSSDNGAVSVTNVEGGRPPYTFRLNGEDRGQSTLFANLVPGEYDIQVTDANGCFSNLLLDITQPEELTVSLRFPGDSSTVASGEEIFISATINGGNPVDTLLWQPDSLTNPADGMSGINFIAEETRMISVTVVDELGCTASDSRMLLVRKDRPVYFPTAFSPNGDNINDVFFINADMDNVTHISDFRIFDRWGETVYTAPQTTIDVAGGQSVGGFLPNDPAFGWDGTLNGERLNPQVFVYTATVHFRDGETFVYKGDFVLMR